MIKRLLFAGALVCFPLLSPGQPKSGVRAPMAVDLAEAEKNGQRLVADLLAQKPAQNSTNTGVMLIRQPASSPRTIPIRFEITATGDAWVSAYEANVAAGSQVRLVVIHTPGRPNEYLLTDPTLPGARNANPKRLSGNETMVPFAGSDFWAGDLGLEFLHWPKQLLLRKEMKRGRSCDVLESINPQPATGAYSRVVSWMDPETGGIVHADAYDVGDELLKQFDPKEFKKVQGQWQLEGMEIRNRQTGSRTKIEFQFDKP